MTRCATPNCSAPAGRALRCPEHYDWLTRDVWNGDREAHAKAVAHDREIIDRQLRKKR